MCKTSGGVDADLPVVAKNPGTAADTDSSEDWPAPHPEVEGSLSGSPCGRSERSLPRLVSVLLEMVELAARKELTLDNLSSSVRGVFSSPLSKSVSVRPVADCLTPDQGRKEVNPLNIGNGIARRG